MTRKKIEAYEVCVIKFGVGFHKDGVVRESEFYRKRKAAMNRYRELRTAYGILTDDIASDTRFWRQAYSPDIWVEIQETSK